MEVVLPECLAWARGSPGDEDPGKILLSWNLQSYVTDSVFMTKHLSSCAKYATIIAYGDDFIHSFS